MWNLKVKGTNVVGYNQRFQELALMCDRMFHEESDMIEKYVGGLPDMIHGSVMAIKPKTMQDAIEFATGLMDKKISTLAERQAENKRKLKDTSRNNPNQQQSFKMHNVAGAYTAGSAQGHFKNNFPKLKNENKEDQDGNGNDVARAYGVGIAETNLNSNVVMGTFLLNNRYASLLFDTGADRSFVSATFSSWIDIIPTTLDHGIDAELADAHVTTKKTEDKSEEKRLKDVPIVRDFLEVFLEDLP
nr:hypothetical protein [Tanacetum cinerariifolium]